MPTIDLSVLDDQISAVRNRLEAEKQQLTKIQESITKDEAKLDALTEFWQLVGNNGQSKSRPASPLVLPEEKSPKKLKASAAIVELLQQHPKGLERSAIIAAVVPRMDSIAANPIHIIRTTLFNMKRSDRLEYDEATKTYRLPD